jgi:hypothetical protein
VVIFVLVGFNFPAISRMTTHAQRSGEASFDAMAPVAMYWSYDQVVDWIESIGFPMYKVMMVLIFIL